MWSGWGTIKINKLYKIYVYLFTATVRVNDEVKKSALPKFDYTSKNKK